MSLIRPRQFFFFYRMLPWPDDPGGQGRNKRNQKNSHRAVSGEGDPMTSTGRQTVFVVSAFTTMLLVWRD